MSGPAPATNRPTVVLNLRVPSSVKRGKGSVRLNAFLLKINNLETTS